MGPALQNYWGPELFSHYKKQDEREGYGELITVALTIAVYF